MRVIGTFSFFLRLSPERKISRKDCPLSESKDQSPERTNGIPGEGNVPRHRVPTPIKVFNAQTGEHLEVPFQKRVSTLLLKLGMDPETVLVIQKDSLLLPGDSIDPQFEVEIRPVISGGSEQ